jgi:hypothetical protein
MYSRSLYSAHFTVRAFYRSKSLSSGSLQNAYFTVRAFYRSKRLYSRSLYSAHLTVKRVSAAHKPPLPLASPRFSSLPLASPRCSSLLNNLLALLRISLDPLALPRSPRPPAAPNPTVTLNHPFLY